jgi:fibronectin-binding autotransporter adhesin
LNGTSARIVRTFDGSGDIDARFSGEISGAQTLHKQEAGTLSLAVANTHTGNTIIEGGVLRLDNPNALGSGNLLIGGGGTLGIGTDTSADPNADFARPLGTGANQLQLTAVGGGGNQANAGFAAYGGNRSVILDGGSTLTWGTNFLSGQSDITTTPNRNFILSNESSDGTLDFKNPIDLNGAVRTVITRNGTAAIDGVLSGTLSNSSGTASGLMKTNSGTLALTGDNSYNGQTTITGGSLLVNNTAGSGTGSSNVAVTAGTLGGTGTIAGTVTVASAARVAPGSSGIESLDVGGLTLSAGSFLDFDLAAPGTSDLINVTNVDGLTINGVGSVNLTNAGGLAAGSYTLIDYAGVLQGGDIASFLSQTPTGPAGFNYSLVDTGSTIDLSVAAIAGDDADFNNDGIVDAADYVLWRKFANTMGTGTQPTGDANGDTNVDGLDYDIWRQQFGEASGAGSDAGGQVPEPATAVMLSFAALLALHRRSRWILA